MARSLRKVVAKALWGRENTALREEYNKLVTEVDELKTNFIALCAKLDADAANAALNDTDYESTLTPAATEAKKIG
jgi:hypothetical protein